MREATKKMIKESRLKELKIEDKMRHEGKELEMMIVQTTGNMFAQILSKLLAYQEKNLQCYKIKTKFAMP